MLLSRGSNSFTKTTTLDNVWVSRCWLEGSFAQHQNQPWSEWDPAQKQVSYKNTELAHHYVYIPWVKKTCSSILRQVLTDFQFFFTGGFCNKYATRFSLKFPPHLSMSLHYLAKLLLRTHSTFSKLLAVRWRVQVQENQHDIHRSWG